MANYTVKKEEIAKQLLARGTSLKIGGEFANVEELLKQIDSVQRTSVDLCLADNPLVGGSPARSSQGIGGTAFLEARWRQKLFNSATVEQYLKQADSSLHRRQPVIPANQPVTVTLNDEHGAPKPLLVYRSFLGINAVEMKTGKLVWGTPSKWSLESMLGDSKHASAIKSWLQFYVSPTAVPASCTRTRRSAP